MGLRLPLAIAPDGTALVEPEDRELATRVGLARAPTAKQHLMWFTAPPGTEAAAQLELLSVIGTQGMTAASAVVPR